jgi:hypothetical protein
MRIAGIVPSVLLEAQLLARVTHLSHRRVIGEIGFDRLWIYLVFKFRRLS